MLSRQCRARLVSRSQNYGAIRSTARRSAPSSLYLSPAPGKRVHIQESATFAAQRRSYATPTANVSPNNAVALEPFSHHNPSTSAREVPDHLQNLRVHLSASLLPVNQHLSPTSDDTRLSKTVLENENGSRAEAVFGYPNDDGLGETVVGLVSPFEGGDCYNREAVLQAAAHLGAEVVRIDLALAIGLSDTVAMKGAPRMQDKQNPLFSKKTHASEEADDRDGEMEFNESGEGHIKIPVMTLGAVPGQSHKATASAISADWVGFFHAIINVNDSDRPRIIYLEACSTMLPTFSTWWPSLAQTLRSRRQKTRQTGGRKTASRSGGELGRPTTVVLSFAPSLLHSHTGVSGENAAGRHRHEEAWWGSAEDDVEGRTTRDNFRLETLRDSDLDALQLIPSADKPTTPAANPLLAAIASQLGSQAPDEDSEDRSLLWQALPIIPLQRDLELEKTTRTTWRRTISSGLLTRALRRLQTELKDTKEGRSRADSGLWTNEMISWQHAQDLAIQAVGRRQASTSSVTCSDLISAEKALKREHQQLRDRVQHLLPPQFDAQDTSDPVLDKLRSSSDLDKYEKRLLPCIVDGHKLASANFSRVHLPLTTIDAIRTMVSLPLLYPEAFRTGILGEQSAGGALLFGPPGTGKTLLARAVAAESGARMLAIQPSDVNDMYVGEGEKLVRAVFSLARKLSPCVVFIDEVDSLFGARSGKDSSGSGRSHNQLLTEFMQEMDGLNSAVTNREQRLVVVGATNRPFDLDEAVLRRMPRRLLIDLPGLEDRKSILEILLQNEDLAADVDLARLAALTDGFSGSDLKHLCVAAALTSLKQTVELPWLSNRKETPGFASLPRRSAGQKAEVTEPSLTSTSSAAEPPYRHAIGAHRAASTLLQAVSSRSVLFKRSPSTKELARLHTSSADTDPSVDGSATKETGTSTRVIHWKHFETALSEISPSSTEDGTLPELRKWAEQYGDGGSKRSPKKGFGKGFGFGNLAPGPSTAYGRVKIDE